MDEVYRVVAKSSALEDNDPVQDAFGDVDDPRDYSSRENAEGHVEELSDAGDREVHLQRTNPNDEADFDAYLVSYDPPEPRFESIRKEILERDDCTCQECGHLGDPDDGSLHVHHITPRSQGGSNDPENLKTLCSDCHQFLHAEEARRGTVEELREIVRRYDKWYVNSAELQDIADDHTESPRFSKVGQKLGYLADRWGSLVAVRQDHPALFIYTDASEPNEYGIPDPDHVYPIEGYWNTPQHNGVASHSGSWFPISPIQLFITEDADSGPARIRCADDFDKSPESEDFDEPPDPEDLFICGQCKNAFAYATVEQDNALLPRFRGQTPPRAEQRRQHQAYFCEDRPPLPELFGDPKLRTAFSRALVKARDPEQPTHVEQVITVLLERKPTTEDENTSFTRDDAPDIADDINQLDADAVSRALYCLQKAERARVRREESATEYLNIKTP